MKRTRTIVIISLITFLSAICSGESYAEEDIVQDFQTMYSNGTLTLSANQDVGVTDWVTYTCNNNKVAFGPDHVNSPGYKVVSLVFNQYGQMTTTAIENLKEILIAHLPAKERCTGMQISLSSDSTSWTLLEGDAISYVSGSIKATFPKGRYFIRMVNTENKTVSVSRMRYTVHNCNCFPYQESE